MRQKHFRYGESHLGEPENISTISVSFSDRGWAIDLDSKILIVLGIKLKTLFG
jgi:hypothetical protein